MCNHISRPHTLPFTYNIYNITTRYSTRQYQLFVLTKWLDYIVIQFLADGTNLIYQQIQLNDQINIIYKNFSDEITKKETSG